MIGNQSALGVVTDAQGKRDEQPSTARLSETPSASVGPSLFPPPCPGASENTPPEAEPFDHLYEVEEPPEVPTFDREAVQLETTGTTSQSQASAGVHTARGAQPEFWRKQTAHKESVAAKLREAGLYEEAEKLSDCHTRKTFAECTGCRKVSVFFNRCDRFYCPECQPSLSKRRKRAVEWWTREVRFPKHVVLTARNTEEITRGTVDRFKKALAKLRRRVVARNWAGGFYTLELTNEGRGWHLHAHLLVDAKWIPSGLLAETWAQCIGQEFAIVKVKDVRDDSYLAEVTKYTVKGSDLSKWSADDLASYIRAFNGVRTFGVFGSLYGKRTEFAEWFRAVRDSKPPCDCGCAEIRFLDENEWHAEGCTQSRSLSPRPPPSPQLGFDLLSEPEPRHAVLAGL